MSELRLYIFIGVLYYMYLINVHRHVVASLWLHYTQGLKKQCKEYEEWDDNYRQMMKLSDVAGSQPDGFLVRFPFYVIAERDAHIVFSASENPDWFVDDVYEFGKYNNPFSFILIII